MFIINKKCAVIITASGKGIRMGSDIPKQYIEIENKPILAYTLDVFEKSSIINEIILVVNEDYISYCKKDIIKKYKYKKIKQIIAGKTTRQLSVLEGLKLAEKYDYILIHDGVRPFVTENEIIKAYKGALEHNAYILALPLSDTVKKADSNNYISETLNRENLFLAQTPQGFNKDLLVKANEKALRENYLVTDDASLIEAYGEKVYIGEGLKSNIKITSKEDLSYAKFLLANKPLTDSATATEDIDIDQSSGQMKIDIYTDGACSNNPGPGGYGAVILGNGKRREISGGYEQTTNNRMEIMAVIKALSLIKEKCKINIYSDSKYVVDAISKNWAKSWQRNNWVKSDKKPALNVDLWQEMLDLLEKQDVTFIWVKGHSSNIENNRCDELAREAILKGDLKSDIGYKYGKN